MEVIEEFIKGKYEKQELCEDAIVVSENFIAVIDGVTSQETIAAESFGKNYF